jgi:hypothetical protein
LATGLGGEENVKSTGDNYEPVTLSSYLEKARVLVEQRFPNNATVKDSDFFDNLRENIPKIAGRRLQRGMNDDDIAVKSVPVFRKSSMKNRILLNPDKRVENATDLFTIQENLWKSNDKGIHETRAQLNIIFSSDGRGGEVKFLSYKKMYWETEYGVPVAKWFQQKQVTSALTCWTNDYDDAETCVFHALASFWSVEDGLARVGNPFQNPKSAEARAASYMFPSTHKMNDASVAQKLTLKLKTLVPDGLKQYISVKGLRIGASTAMAADRLVTLDQSIFRGGWSTHTSRDHYVWILLFEILAPMMALAGHPDATALPTPPSLDALPMTEVPMLQKFIQELYVISIPFFLPDGKLRPLLYACTACLIMHFPQVLKKYSRQDALISKMISSGLEGGLGNTPATVIAKLDSWSKLIREDYDRRKCHTQEARSEILNRLISIQRRMASDNHHLTGVVSSLLAEVSMLRSSHKELNCKIDALQNTFVLQMQELKQLFLSSGKHQTQNLSTDIPGPAKNSPLAAPGIVGFLKKSPPSTISPEIARVQAVARPHQRQQPPSALDMLSMGTKAHGINATSYAATKVSDVLFELYCLEGKPLKNLGPQHPLSTFRYTSSIPRSVEKKYEAAMTLADALLTTEMRSVLIKGTMPRNDAKKVFLGIDGWVKKATAAFDGKSKVGNRRRASWQGVGNNIASCGRLNFIKGYIPTVPLEDLEHPNADTTSLGKWIEAELENNGKT